MRRALAILVGLLLAFEPVLAQAANDLSAPPPGYQPGAGTDEGGLWMMYQKVEQQIAVSPSRVTDPALNAYVKGVICKMAADQCGSIRLYLIESPDFNAATLGNGALLVFTGMLVRLENEAELACVLGHEITHYTRKHQLDQFRRATNTSNALAFFNVLTAGLTMGLAGLAATVIASGNFFAYGRDQEREADAGGFDLMTAAGYNPRACARNWEFVAAEHNANPRKKDDFFFATHPTNEERLATLKKRADEIFGTRTDWATNDSAFQAAIAPYRQRWLEDEINRGEPEESVVMLQRLVDEEPGSGLLRYYLGVSYRKRGGPDDAKYAGDAYAAAIATGNAPPVVWRDQGLIAMRAGDKANARDDFNRYLAAAPGADDKAMIQFYLNQLAGT